LSGWRSTSTIGALTARSRRVLEVSGCEPDRNVRRAQRGGGADRDRSADRRCGHRHDRARHRPGRSLDPGPGRAQHAGDRRRAGRVPGLRVHRWSGRHELLPRGGPGPGGVHRCGCGRHGQRERGHADSGPPGGHRGRGHHGDGPGPGRGQRGRDSGPLGVVSDRPVSGVQRDRRLSGPVSPLHEDRDGRGDRPNGPDGRRDRHHQRRCGPDRWLPEPPPGAAGG
jgi:hypothetical protein